MQWYLMTILIYYEKHVVQINLTKKEEKKKKVVCITVFLSSNFFKLLRRKKRTILNHNKVWMKP